MNKPGRKRLEPQRRVTLAKNLARCVRDKFGTVEAFQEHLRRRHDLSPRAPRRWFPNWDRVREWLDGGSDLSEAQWRACETPDLRVLVILSDVLDVSIDHLLGYPVPKRRSDRRVLGRSLTRSDAGVVLAGDVLRAISRSRRDRKEWDFVARRLGGEVVPSAQRTDAGYSATVMQSAKHGTEVRLSEPGRLLNRTARELAERILQEEDEHLARIRDTAVETIELYRPSSKRFSEIIGL